VKLSRAGGSRIDAFASEIGKAGDGFPHFLPGLEFVIGGVEETIDLGTAGGLAG